MICVCPKCDVGLFIVHLRDIEVDYCERCRGIWLDAGELEALIENPNDPIFKLLDQSVVNPHTKKHLCPRCDAPLVEIKLPANASSSPLLLDRCPNNHGYWFDGGELPELLAISPTAPGAARASALLREIFATNPKPNKEKQNT